MFNSFPTFTTRKIANSLDKLVGESENRRAVEILATVWKKRALLTTVWNVVQRKNIKRISLADVCKQWVWSRFRYILPSIRYLANATHGSEAEGVGTRL